MLCALYVGGTGGLFDPLFFVFFLELFFSTPSVHPVKLAIDHLHSAVGALTSRGRLLCHLENADVALVPVCTVPVNLVSVSCNFCCNLS